MELPIQRKRLRFSGRRTVQTTVTTFPTDSVRRTVSRRLSVPEFYCRSLIATLAFVTVGGALAGCGERTNAPASPKPTSATSAPQGTQAENPVEKRARLVAATLTAPDDPSALLHL